MGIEAQLIEEIKTIGRLKKSLAGQVVISPETVGAEMPIVLSGLLKVMRQDENGDEVFLYYLEGGETCAMSITCCFDGVKASYKVVVEEDSAMWMIPVPNMDVWVEKYPMFRRFVFTSYQLRFEELLTTIDSVVFYNLDERLYRYLLDTKQATEPDVIIKTHE